MARQFEIPNELRRHVSETLGDQGAAWLQDLPEIADRLQSKWEITLDRPFEAGEFNFVAPAVRSSGDQVVMKIAPPFPDGEYASEVAFLRYRDGAGCVRLLECETLVRAMLLERALPGRNLADEFAGKEPESIGPAINVLRRIQTEPPVRLKDVIFLDKWFDGLRRYIGTDFPDYYARNALEFYADLTARGKPGYLHGDFHPANIVSATREPYLAIDPKGIIGPIGYDIAVFLNNYHWWQSGRSDIKERLGHAVKRFSKAFDIPEKDLARWAFAVQVLGSWWMYDEMPAVYSGGVAKADIWDI